jgi:hypothetical protein
MLISFLSANTHLKTNDNITNTIESINCVTDIL